MRWGDLLGIAFSALYQQKVRTALSILGVTIGTFALALSLSVGQGVESAILSQLRRNDQLRKIMVWANYEVKPEDVPPEALKVEGAMSPAKRERLRDAIVQRWRRDHVTQPRAKLTAAKIQEVGALEHVASANPVLDQQGHAVLDGKSSDVVMVSAGLDGKSLRGRLVAGDFFTADAAPSLLIHEYLLYSWGITSDDDVRQVVGRKVRLEFQLGRMFHWPLLSILTGGRVTPESPENKVVDRVIKRLPALLDATEMTDDERRAARSLVQGLSPPTDPVQEPPIAAEFTIAGVVRQVAKDDPQPTFGEDWQTRDADVFLPPRTAQDFFFRAEPIARDGANRLTVTVDHEENVKAVNQKLKDLGYQPNSLVEIIEQFRMNVLMITFAVAFIAAVALLVAAIGITNTMIMSVLERTREIGVMKAVGARERHIQLIFLVEGALIGMLGSVSGLLLSWFASFPGNAIARSIMERQTRTPTTESLFAFPLIVTLGVPAVACLVTTLAAAYPARRAVRVNPVTSLRHE